MDLHAKLFEFRDETTDFSGTVCVNKDQLYERMYKDCFHTSKDYSTISLYCLRISKHQENSWIWLAENSHSMGELLEGTEQSYLPPILPAHIQPQSRGNVWDRAEGCYISAMLSCCMVPKGTQPADISQSSIQAALTCSTIQGGTELECTRKASTLRSASFKQRTCKCLQPIRVPLTTVSVLNLICMLPEHNVLH